MSSREIGVRTFIMGVLVTGLVCLLIPDQTVTVTKTKVVEDKTAIERLEKERAEAIAAQQKAEADRELAAQQAAAAEAARAEVIAQLEAAKEAVAATDPANHTAPVEASEPEHPGWFYSIDDAKAKAAELGRPIFVPFCYTGCRPCLQVKASLYEDASIKQRLRENFVRYWCAVAVKNGKPVNDADFRFASDQGVSMYPTCAVVSGDKVEFFRPTIQERINGKSSWRTLTPGEFHAELDNALDKLK